LLLIGILFLSACGGGGAAPKPAPVSTQPAPAPPASQQGEARVVDVTLNYVVPRFQPDPIVLKVGEPVQFKLTSINARHTFIIKELGIDVEVPQPALNQAVTTGVVVPQRAGDFLLFCRFHLRFPMEARVIITD
jgi:heme/copper-type cytochrome/quinol oxidase subunit 2